MMGTRTGKKMKGQMDGQCEVITQTTGQLGILPLGYFNIQEGNKVNCISLLFIYLIKLG